MASGAVALVVCLASLSGCGGGGDGSRLGGTLGGDSGTEQAIGLLTTRIVGTAQPPVISSMGSGAVVTGVAGASFTRLAQNRATSRFAYVAVGQIYTVSATGNGAATQITTDATNKSIPTWSPDGARIAYIAGGDFRTGGDIYVIPATGGNPTPITNGYPTTRASWSPDGSKLAFAANGQIFTVPSGGGITPTQITHDQQGWTDVCWSPDGSKFVGSADETGNGEKLFTLPSDGSGTPTFIASDGYFLYPSVSPDGSKIAYYNQVGHAMVVSVSGGEPKSLYAFQAVGGNRVTWSPDSTRISLLAINFSPLTIHVVIVSVDGGEQTLIGPDVNGCNDFAWSPFLSDPEAAPLLGDNGPLGNASAAGILFAQSGNKVLSVLAFDTANDTADSRSEARIAEMSAGNTDDSFRAFTISAPDGLGKVSYVSLDSATGAPGPVVAPILPPSSPSAVILFDTVTGKIALVAPFAPNPVVGASRSAASKDVPQVVRQGKTLILKGDFPAVFDAMGKNRASAGATEVHLDFRTGEILSAL